MHPVYCMKGGHSHALSWALGFASLLFLSLLFSLELVWDEACVFGFLGCRVLYILRNHHLRTATSRINLVY